MILIIENPGGFFPTVPNKQESYKRSLNRHVAYNCNHCKNAHGDSGLPKNA